MLNRLIIMSDRRSAKTHRFTAFDTIQAAPAMNSTELIRLMRGVRSVAQLQATLDQALPPDLRPHVQGCLSQGAELVLQAASAQWAFRIRQLSGALLKHPACRRWRRIKVVVGKTEPLPPTALAPVVRAPVGAEAGDRLRQTAAAIDDDQLSDSLQRLAHAISPR